MPNVKPEMLKIERVGIGRAFFPQEGEYPCLVFEARNAAGEIQQVPVGSSAYIVVDAQGSRILASAG
ncbi:MAG: hypothetical protein HY474_01275 [Candidatus Sungbacteria bacterium]|uniref:Uncharacterized protein n=1 Tax=Candidatus Sungiibacteriota bacterium TaxID=2750080 RepID=A0A932YVK5_9BACT|nr:hypothetical protein [Candidatus Sungbacteria bacterium]